MSQPDITRYPAVDVHAHYGVCHSWPQRLPLHDRMLTADAAEVVRRATNARTQWTVASPLLALFPRGGGDPVAGNEEAFAVAQRTPSLLQWVVVDPTTPDTYPQARDMLQAPHCVGIKIHPEEHVYPIARHGGKLCEFAGKHQAVVLAHSGDLWSLPADYLPFADAVPEMKLILAHIGHGPGGDTTLQVRAAAAARHGNVLADTSSVKSIFPNLIEWAVSELGVERVLYGTDTPLYSASMQRARIDQAELTDAQKRRILRDNAVELLGLDRLPASVQPAWQP